MEKTACILYLEQGLDMELVGIADEEKNRGRKVFGHKVVGLKDVSDLNPEAVLITSVKDQTSYIKTLTKHKEWNSFRIFTI